MRILLTANVLGTFLILVVSKVTLTIPNPPQRRRTTRRPSLRLLLLLLLPALPAAPA
jgi:hypothetical protein